MTKISKFASVDLPLGKLTLHPDNVRATSQQGYDAASIQSLADNIAEYGLLQPLLVQELEDGTYGVLAGGRRLSALNSLNAASIKGYGSRAKVACSVVPADCDSATALSLSENILQLPMDAIDRFEAFSKMYSEGQSIEKIARSFCIEERKVKESLRIGNIHADIRAAYRAGDLTLDALKAFDGHPDQSVQLEVYQRLAESGSVQVWNIKQAFSQHYIRVGSPLGQFVIEEYKAAGGSITQDLIEEDSILSDDPLIQSLLETKLHDLAEEERILKGFAWADIRIMPDWNAFADFGRVYPQEVSREDMSEDRLKRVETIETELKDLEGLEQSDGLDDEQYDRYEQLTEQLRDLCEDFSAEDLANSGIIAVWNGRSVQVYAGMVRPDDVAAKQSAENSGASEPGQGKPQYSAALTRDLEETRTRAVAVALSQKPDLARDYCDFAVVSKVFTRSYANIGIDLSVKTPINEWKGEDPNATARQAIEELDACQFVELDLDWTNQETIQDQFEAFRDLSDAQRQKQLAYAVSRMMHPEGFDTRGSSLRAIIDAEALPNIRDAWTPDVAFLSRLNKTQLLTILAEDLGMPHKASEYASVKKSVIVAAVAACFSSSEPTAAAAAWVPELMRTTPATDADSDQSEAHVDLAMAAE